MIVDNSYLDAFINKKKSFHMAFVGNKRNNDRRNKDISKSTKKKMKC